MCMGLNVCAYRGLSRVWCVKRVLVDWNSLNYRDWKEGRRESTSIYNTQVTFSLFVNKLYFINLINMIIREKRNRKW